MQIWFNAINYYLHFIHFTGLIHSDTAGHIQIERPSHLPAVQSIQVFFNAISAYMAFSGPHITHKSRTTCALQAYS